MSLATNIARSLYEDARHAAMAPVRLGREIQYTINGLQDGSIPPKYVGWTLVSTTGAALLAAILMFPIYWMFTIAIGPPSRGVYTTELALIPPEVTLKNFIWVIGELTWPEEIVIHGPLVGELLRFTNPKFITISEIGFRMENPAFPRAFLLDPAAQGIEATANRPPSGFIAYAENSAYVAFWTVVVAMSVIVPGAYAMSRRDFMGRKKLLYLYVLLTQVGGGLGIALLVALWSIFRGFGWLGELLPLAVYYGAGAVPFNTWLLKTYMDGIPISYEEAAIVDGAPSWRIVYEVIIPLSMAGLATIFVFVFLAGWTDYIVAAQLLNPENYTLPVGLFELVGERNSTPWPRFAAFALTFATPLMLVYFFAQRYIESGLSFGGMEG